MAKIHELKILPEYFEAVQKGVKTWELRFNDRNFAVGDMLMLREWNASEYTGRSFVVKITYILKGHNGLSEGWVILSIKKFKEAKK